MIGRIVLVGLAVLLVATGWVGASPGPSASVVWKAVPLVRNVSLGDPIQLIVYGPANGSFFVSVQAEPFNHTYPLFNSTYTLPNGSSNQSKSALVTIPTTYFSYGPYLASVVNSSALFVVAYVPFFIVNPLNATVVNNDLSFIWAELNYTQAREISLRDQYYALESQVEELFWLTFVGFLIVIGVVLITRTGLANTRIGKYLRRVAHGLAYADKNSDPWKAGGIGAPGERVLVDPARSWTSDLFPTCDECLTLTLEKDKVLHLRQDHGVPNPRPPRDYHQFLPAVRAAVERNDVTKPVMSKVRQALDAIPDSAFEGLGRA